MLSMEIFRLSSLFEALRIQHVIEKLKVLPIGWQFLQDILIPPFSPVVSSDLEGHFMSIFCLINVG